MATGRLALHREECDGPHLDAVASAQERLQSIVEETLALARQGERVGETAPVDLAGLAAECWRTVDTGDAAVLVGDVPTVEADADRLRHVFENLFRNGVRHGAPDGRPAGDDGGDPRDHVTVRVGPIDDGTGFYVADDGPGIPADRRERVFDLGHTTAADGGGYGLTNVRRIVEAHGWEIVVVESEGGGARFEIDGVATVDGAARSPAAPSG